MIASKHVKLYALILLAVAHIFISLLTIIPGYINIDEITYHLMVKHFSETGEFAIWNGYREYPSPELVYYHAVVHNGKLFPQYPSLFPLLSTPFYRLGGYFGVFFMNVFAFLGIVALCYAIAQKLFRDRNLALNACFILVLATFSWEYSQAAWPHATVTLFIVGAFYLFICSSFAQAPRKTLILGLIAGLIAGFAPGIRLDAIFVLPCIVLPFIFLRPYRYRQALTVCIGTLPGFALLSVTNFIKFGSFFPFSYGGIISFSRFLPLIPLGASLFIGLWILTRFPLLSLLWRHTRLTLFGIAGIIMMLLLLPPTRNTIKKQMNKMYQITVDFRVRDRNIQEPSLSRSRGGGMVFLGGLKKSLLQSCPYLVILLLPLLHIFRREKRDTPSYPPNPSLLLLFLIPVTFTGVYGYYALHGGLCWNLRYLVPILPVTSILSAYAWRELNGTRHWPGRTYLFVILGIFIVDLYFFLLRPSFRTVDQQEFLYLTLPLILAGVLLVLLILQEILVATEIRRHREKSLCFSLDLSIQRKPDYKRWAPPLRWRPSKISQLTAAICFVAMVWSGVVALGYDYPLARRTRKDSLHVAEQTAHLIADESILFTTFPNPFFCLVEYRQIRIANAGIDDFRDFPGLITFHLNAGHAVYGAFPSQQWADLRRSGLLDPTKFKVLPLEFFDQILCRITAK